MLSLEGDKLKTRYDLSGQVNDNDYVHYRDASHRFDEFIVEREDSTEISRVDRIYVNHGILSQDEVAPKKKGRPTYYKVECTEPSGQYGGLTAEALMERYEKMQREDSYKLTPSQIASARELWSAQLRAKTDAQKTLDAEKAVSVVVETDLDD